MMRNGPVGKGSAMMLVLLLLVPVRAAKNLRAQSYYESKFEAWKLQFSHEPKPHNESLAAFADARGGSVAPFARRNTTSVS